MTRSAPLLGVEILVSNHLTAVVAVGLVDTEYPSQACGFQGGVELILDGAPTRRSSVWRNTQRDELGACMLPQRASSSVAVQRSDSAPALAPYVMSLGAH